MCAPITGRIMPVGARGLPAYGSHQTGRSNVMAVSEIGCSRSPCFGPRKSTQAGSYECEVRGVARSRPLVDGGVAWNSTT